MAIARGDRAAGKALAQLGGAPRVGITRRELEHAIRHSALDIMWANLAPTATRTFADKRSRPADRIRMLELLWEVGRDHTQKIESKSLQAHVDVSVLKGILEADPNLRTYLNEHPDVRQRLGAAPADSGDTAGRHDDDGTPAP